MTINELIQLKYALENCTDKRAHLYMIKGKKQGGQRNFSVLKAEILPNISTAFTSMFEIILKDLLDKNPDIAEYDIDCTTGEYLQYIDASEVPNFELIRQSINEPTTPPLGNVDSDFLKTLWAYAVKVTFGDKYVIYFRKYSSGKVLSRGTFDAIVFKEGRFSKLEDEDVFSIDGYIDCFFYNEHIWIIQSTHFERIFDYEELYVTAAETALEQIATAYNFSDPELLKNSVASDSRLKRKLASIINNQNIGNVSFNNIVHTIREHQLPIQTDETNEQIYVNKDNVFKVIKVLNDDYVTGDTTRGKYEALSKRRTRR
jgi:hypothetical protein